MNNSAGARVAGTTELLEAILISISGDELGFFTLLLSQRTSRAFRDTIQGSIHLRRALHLEASTSASDAIDDVGQHGLCPLLQPYLHRSGRICWGLAPPMYWNLGFDVRLTKNERGDLKVVTSLGAPMHASSNDVLPSWKRMCILNADYLLDNSTMWHDREKRRSLTFGDLCADLEFAAKECPPDSWSGRGRHVIYEFILG